MALSQCLQGTAKSNFVQTGKMEKKFGKAVANIDNEADGDSKGEEDDDDETLRVRA